MRRSSMHYNKRCFAALRDNKAVRMRWLIAMALGLLGLAAQAQDLLQPQDAAQWQVQTFRRLPATIYTFTPQGLKVHAVRSSALLLRRIEPPQAAPRVAWWWRVDQSGPATDLTKKGRDDRPLAIHFWFATDKKPGIWARLWQRAQTPMAGKSISYTWGGRAEAGAVLANPFLPRDGVIVVLQPGDAALRQWRREQVNLAADYQRVFGIAAPAVAAVAISGDSDDSRAESIGWVKELVILPQQ